VPDNKCHYRPKVAKLCLATTYGSLNFCMQLFELSENFIFYFYCKVLKCCKMVLW